MSKHLRSSSRHLLFVLAGTGGDVWPALELARAACEVGDEVDVATYEHFEPEVRAKGLRFHSIGSSEQYLNAIRNPASWSRKFIPPPPAHVDTGQFSRTVMRRIIALVGEMQERRPVLVCTHNCYGARFASELYGLIFVSLIHAPQQLLTDERIPYPLNTRIMRALPRWYSRAMLRRSPLEKYRPTINDMRYSLGMPPIKNFFEWLYISTPKLALFPDWFDDLKLLASSSIGQGDFLLRNVDESDTLDDRLEHFLDVGSPPVVCTLGTGITHAASRYASVAEALTKTGRRGLFVTPFNENIQFELGNHIMHVSYVNLATVLRRASLAVHHGGIGTVSQAFRAGTRQLILPFSFDQPDNGNRVRMLGAGLMIEAPEPDATIIADAIDRTCALPSDTLETLRGRALNGGGPQACLHALKQVIASNNYIVDSDVDAAHNEYGQNTGG